MVVVLLAVVVCAVVPSVKDKVVDLVHHLKYDVAPSYPVVPVQAVNGAGSGGCTVAQLAKNDTVYWYTRPLSDGPQTLTITIPPGFSGTIARIAFTPLVAAVSPPANGAASPNPEELVLSSTPASVAQPITLQNPPKFEQVTVDVAQPTAVRLQLVSTDPGAAPGTCAETGVVLYERTG